MGDFLLDLRTPSERTLPRSGDRMRFAPDTRIHSFDLPHAGIVVSVTGNASLWSPFRAPNGVLVAVAGRPAFDELEWSRAASAFPNEGGLAAKAVFLRYQQSGATGLEQVSGNCVVLVYDPGSHETHFVTDCSGVFPAFECDTSSGKVYCSHPDVLADSAGETHRLDELSLAEFVFTSTITPPFTYYQRIRAVDHGVRITIPHGNTSAPQTHRYFHLDYQENTQDEQELALELASSLRNSVRRRTLPRLGTCAVALSGGLDSRALLACVEDVERVFAFCCFNTPNRELQTAEAIASASRCRFVPLQRDFEYYGDTAEEGVRISGGMGTFANNHFLGAMPRLRAEGMETLLTGCYCDYLFKGLPLNRRSHWLSGRETLAPFQYQFYFSRHTPQPALATRLRERCASRIPAEFQKQDTPAAVFQVEARRSFPLCYEGDNQQRVVPQRITGWSLPVADRDVLNVYRRIPYTVKLNGSVFRKAVLSILSRDVAAVPDANTGAPVDASPARRWLAENRLRLRRKLRNRRQTIATDGSWPDWHYYVTHSQKLAELWRRPNPAAFDLLRSVAGPELVLGSPLEYQNGKVFLFVSLLNLKLWLDQRR